MVAIVVYIFVEILINDCYSSSSSRRSRGREFKWQQSFGKGSERTLDSPTLSHVSVTQRKSKPLDVKKSFRIKVLIASDLAFTSPFLTTGGSVVLTFRGTWHRGCRSCRFTPRQRWSGEQGARGWNTSSVPTTGTSQVSIGSSNHREIKRLGTTQYSVQESIEKCAPGKPSPSPAEHCDFFPCDGGTCSRGVKMGGGRDKLECPIGVGAMSFVHHNQVFGIMSKIQ